MAIKPRPSSMPMLAVSPRWVNRPETPGKSDGYAEAAAIGTLVHDTMYKIALSANDRSKWPGIIQTAMLVDTDVEKLVLESLKSVDDLFSLCLPVYYVEGGRIELSDYSGNVPDGLYPEVGVDSGVTAPGTADLVVIFGEIAEMVDYKNTFIERDHDYQMKSYVVGIFRACPKVKTVKVRIITPRLGEAHDEITYSRDELDGIVRELSEIVQKAEDPFSPCFPGEFCVTCAGNGRCPWQAASLRDVPILGEIIPAGPFEWVSMLDQNPPAPVRSRRRFFIRWLEKFVDSVKEQDKAWALETKDSPEPLVGFKTIYGKGRSSLDKSRMPEINAALMSRFGMPADKMLEYAEVDVERLASFIAMRDGTTETDAVAQIKGTLTPFKIDGTPTASFRVDVKALKSLGPQIAAILA